MVGLVEMRMTADGFQLAAYGLRPTAGGASAGRLHVEFEDVFVLQDMAAPDALAVVARAITESGELEVLGEVFVEMMRRVGHDGDRRSAGCAHLHADELAGD